MKTKYDGLREKLRSIVEAHGLVEAARLFGMSHPRLRWLVDTSDYKRVIEHHAFVERVNVLAAKLKAK